MHQFKRLRRSALFRDVTISEKIDGTNAQVFVVAEDRGRRQPGRGLGGSLRKRTTSVSRRGSPIMLTSCASSAQDVISAEWYGRGIQRRYGLQDRRFALFNSCTDGPRSARRAAAIVPVLTTRTMGADVVSECLETLRSGGSLARSGFHAPGGIVIYHHASGGMFRCCRTTNCPRACGLLTSAHKRAVYGQEADAERTGHPDRAVLGGAGESPRCKRIPEQGVSRHYRTQLDFCERRAEPSAVPRRVRTQAGTRRRRNLAVLHAGIALSGT